MGGSKVHSNGQSKGRTPSYVIQEMEEDQEPMGMTTMLLMLCDGERRKLIIPMISKWFTESSWALHLVWLMLLMAYSLAGGYMFSTIEGTHDRMQQEKLYKMDNESFHKHREWQTKLIVKLRQIDQNDSYEVSEQALEKHKMVLLLRLVNWYDREMGIRIEQPIMGYTKWDILGGVHYAMSIYTTTGYGDLVPKTPQGRIATIAYALMGVPIMVVVMGDLGNMLYTFFQGIWMKVLGKFRQCMRKEVIIEEPPPPVVIPRHDSEGSLGSEKSISSSPLLNAESSEAIQRVVVVAPKRTTPSAMTKQAQEEAKYEEQAILNLPIWVALLILIAWVTFSSFMVSLWEPTWSYFDAIYFYITSLTTIGLGDMVPTTPYKFILAHLASLLVGLSMMSMFINIFNAKVGLLYDRILFLVHKEYRTRQVDPESSLMTTVSSTKATKEGLSRLYERRPLSDRLMYYLMGEHRQRLLEDQWMTLSDMINRRMQTTPQLIDRAVQTGMKSAAEKKKKGSDEEEEEEESEIFYGKGKQPKKPQTLQKKYIYHIFD